MESGRSLLGAVRSAAARAAAPLARAPRPASAPSSSSPAPSALAATAGSRPPGAVGFGEEEEMEGGALVFGPTPSVKEVSEAVTAINQIFGPDTLSGIFKEGSSSSCMDLSIKSPSADGKMHKVSPISSQADGTISETTLYNPGTVESWSIINAFQSLQTNPSLQKMVTSVSSDKAVWNAIMKNDAVKELTQSFREVRSTKMKHIESDNVVDRILDWILEAVKAKILEILYFAWKIGKDKFIRKGVANAVIIEEVVMTAFMLSVVVFIVVIAFRVIRGQ